MYWTPAPPKFDVPPEAVMQQLIPKYTGALFTNQDEIEKFNQAEELSDVDSSSDEGVGIKHSSRFRQRYDWAVNLRSFIK